MVRLLQCGLPVQFVCLMQVVDALSNRLSLRMSTAISFHSENVFC